MAGILKALAAPFAKALARVSELYLEWRAGQQAFQTITKMAAEDARGGLTSVKTDTPGSTCFEWIDYSLVTGRLVVRFRNRAQYPNYVFSSVPRLTYLGWLQTPSWGSYYHRHVKQYSDVRRGR